MADIEVGRQFGQLRGDLLGRADDHIAALDDVLHARRRTRLLAGLEAGGAADLADDAGALRRFGDIARRHCPTRVDAQAAPVEILGWLAVEPHRLFAAFGDADGLQKPGAVWVPLFA